MELFMWILGFLIVCMVIFYLVVSRKQSKIIVIGLIVLIGLIIGAAVFLVNGIKNI